MNQEHFETGVSGRRHNGDRSPDEIEADIDQTRARMDADLAALEDRLSPGHLIDEAMRTLRTGAAAEYFHNLGETAKRNPVPLALVSTGLAWLALSSRSSSVDYGAVSSSDYGYEGAWRRDVGQEDYDDSSVASAAESMKAKAGETWDRASGSASAAVQSARDRAHRVSESARHGMHSAREQARRRAQQARQGARRATEFMYEQPLIAAGVALTIGAVLGGLLPSTRREDELMGSRSDAVKGTVKREAEALVQEGTERVRAVVGSATDTGHSGSRQSSLDYSSASSPTSSQHAGAAGRSDSAIPLGESAATAGPGSLLPEEDLTIGEERGAQRVGDTSMPESSPGERKPDGPTTGSGATGKRH